MTFLGLCAARKAASFASCLRAFSACLMALAAAFAPRSTSLACFSSCWRAFSAILRSLLASFSRAFAAAAGELYEMGALYENVEGGGGKVGCGARLYLLGSGTCVAGSGAPGDLDRDLDRDLALVRDGTWLIGVKPTGELCSPI